MERDSSASTVSIIDSSSGEKRYFFGANINKNSSSNDADISHTDCDRIFSTLSLYKEGIRVQFILSGPFNQAVGNDSDSQLQLWLHRRVTTDSGEDIQQAAPVLLGTSINTRPAQGRSRPRPLFCRNRLADRSIMPGALIPKMECALCSAIITGGVQCGACKKYLDYDCASFPEEDWIKLEDEEKIAWKCPTCLIPSSGYHQISLQAVLEEIRDLKRQLSVLPTLTEAVRIIKEELEDLRNCCGHNVAMVNELSYQLTGLEKQVTDLERLKAVVYTLQSYVERIRFLTTKTGPVRARHYDKAMRKLITYIRV